MTAATQNAVVGSEESADRDIPALSSTKKKNNLSRMVIAGVMVLAVLVVAFGVILFLDRLEEGKKTKAQEQAKAKPAPAVVASSRDFEAAKKRIKLEEAQQMPPPAAAAMAIPMDGATAAPGAAMATPAGAAGTPGAAPAGTPPNASNGAPGTPAAGGGAPAAPVRTLAQRRMSGELLVSSGNSGGSSVSVANHTAPAAGFLGSGGAQGSQSSRGGLDDKLKPSQLVGGVAAQRPDLNFLLRRGTAIPCVQKTRIVTTNPGPVGCVVAKDVYSANGKVLLIERGSESFGELRDSLVAGQSFIPVLWSRIETPLGVVVDINSFGTDSLGASGQPILVDNHIMQRFGGAVLLSLIGDLGQALSNRANEGEGTIRLTTSAKSGQDLANRTLESTINIPPTGYGQPGDVINIFVVRDIDFRSVYELARH
ncbi:conjugal transfer protein TrbI [Massilia eurypsychrophila]|uniref:Conjugal transfer protein TrbI n=1 Tax=Massilia eurypsychrophila TaxID=1485217 RepID=A0A2G8T9H7_9BURK|nr:TrbI/VirB10 family protein [Massilia eurypsychrophila]PIL42639.1 conjugal transfer protein TrbI [Massilia eurypsychrophila]